ncbi:MAG TPA: DUF86 domain-containing protein [Chitinophagales bacterium]|nr:DUF86 domain-containing protein [Chitinophagales bacterium]
MSKRADNLLVDDIAIAIQKILDFTNGISFNEFTNDVKTFDATIRNFEVIGEAASKLSESFILKNHTIEWHKMISTRNHLIHGYFGIDAKIIWNIIQNILPILKIQINELLNALKD